MFLISHLFLLLIYHFYIWILIRIALFKMFVSFSESGEMCAVKEVTLFSDDPKSMESAKQFMQVN